MITQFTFTKEEFEAISRGGKRQHRWALNVEGLVVRCDKVVRSDFQELRMGGEVNADPGLYKASMNRNGAVTLHLPNGAQLGVRPGEFHFECPFAIGLTHLGKLDSMRSFWQITPQDSWIEAHVSLSDSPALRLLLTSVRIQRASDINHDDIAIEFGEPSPSNDTMQAAIDRWDHRNLSAPWGNNPWCWVAAFQPVS